MDRDEVVGGKEKLLVAMSAAMGGGCRFCARGLYAMAPSVGATDEEVERAFLDGLVQREAATQLLRQEAGALLGRPLGGERRVAGCADERISQLGRLAASVALNAAPDALERAEAARAAGASEAQLRVALGIGRSVRGKAQGFSDTELGESQPDGAEPAAQCPSAAPEAAVRAESACC